MGTAPANALERSQHGCVPELGFCSSAEGRAMVVCVWSQFGGGLCASCRTAMAGGGEAELLGARGRV